MRNGKIMVIWGGYTKPLFLIKFKNKLMSIQGAGGTQGGTGRFLLVY